ERAERGESHHAVDEGRHPGGRHVQVHDLRGLALLVVGRRQEGERQAGDEQRRRRRREPRRRPARHVDEDRRVGEIGHQRALLAPRTEAGNCGVSAQADLMKSGSRRERGTASQARQWAIFSSARLAVRGPKSPIVAITTPIAAAMKANTPAAPKASSTKAMTKELKMTERRLQE